VKVVDADGTLLHMNSSGLAMIGADCAEAVVGKSVYDLIDAKDQDRFRAFNEGICRGQKGSLEFGMVGLEGVVRQMETHAAPLRNPDGTVVQLGVTRDVTERKRADEELRRSEERFRTLADALDMQVQIRTQELERRNLEIRQQAEQLRELSNRLLQTQDEERRRVARELHDGVGQVLAGVNMALAKLDKERYSLSFEARQSLTESTMLIEQASREVRTVSHLLHPPMLDEIGLESALRWYVEGFAKRSKIAVDMQLAPGFSKGLPRDVALSLYRVVQECLTNVHRHSGSKAAFVGIHRSSVEITLRVKDEGAGISPDIQTKIALGEDSGVGLRGMRERIQQLRGRFEIDSDQNGTRIGAVLPISDWVAPEVNPIPGRAASAL
jgi:PAS domain S-box-containing protein